jgi:hypothetical protein
MAVFNGSDAYMFSQLRKRETCPECLSARRHRWDCVERCAVSDVKPRILKGVQALALGLLIRRLFFTGTGSRMSHIITTRSLRCPSVIELLNV